MSPLRTVAASILLAAFPGALGAQAAEAPPVPPAFADLPAIVFQYYDIRGGTQKELADALKNAAETEPLLVEEGKTPAPARTRWKADFGWDTQRMSGLCRTRRPRTMMSVIVILPRLADPDRATPQALAAWRGYLATIEQHEAGHARIAFAHARDFETEAYGARCEEIRAIGQRIVDRIVALQEDYERRTDYGRKQGDITQ